MIKKQVKVGVILSYILIVLNTIYGLFLTPYIVGCLGEAEYGVYKTIAALGSSLAVLDLGIGGTVTRYIASYVAKKEDEKIPNFAAMSMLQAGALCFLLLLACSVVFFLIKPIYSSSFLPEQIGKAQMLFVVLAVNMMLHVLSNVIYGIIAGYNRFSFGNTTKLLRLVFKIALIFVLLKFIPDSLVLVFTDLLLTIVFIVVDLIYVRKKIGLRIKLTNWDKKLFIESGLYTGLMFLTSVAAQINNNVDNVIIGAIRGPSLVTIYSMGLLIFAMYENLSCSISGVMLPTVSNVLEQKDGQTAVQKLIVKVGRIQFMLLGAAVVGFVFVGKSFIKVWLGEGFEDVYIITLILMLPSLFELCVNVCLAVLRAKNMLGFRTGVLFASTVLNVVVTVLAVKYWSYIGAALGTAMSFLFGSVIVMNIYYYRKLGFNMLKIYKGIFSRIWLCLCIAGGALFLSTRFLGEGLLPLVINILVFCVVYGATLMLFGLTKEEKCALPIIGKYFRK